MELTIKSPFTGGLARLQEEIVQLPYKGQEYEVFRQYYKCQESGEQFTTPSQHDAVILQLRAKASQKSEGVLSHVGAIPLVVGSVGFVSGFSSHDPALNGATDSYNQWLQGSDRLQKA